MNLSVLWKISERGVALGKHMVIAAVLGLSAQVDVFYMAHSLLGILVFSWAMLIDVVFVPSMVKVWREQGRRALAELASGLFSLVLMGSALLALLMYVGKEMFASVAIGFESARQQLLSDAFVWLLPVVFLYVPLRLMVAVLRSVRQFSALYQSDFVLALSVFVCVGLFRNDPHVLLWSLSIGVGAAFVFLLIQCRQFVLPLGAPFAYPVRQSLHLMWGLLILQGAQYVYALTDRIFVSFLPVGSVSALAYTATLVALLPSLINLPSAFITIIAEQPRIEQRARRLNELLSVAVFIALGATCFMVLAGASIVEVLLERGVFTTSDTQIVASALAAYAWIIIPLLLLSPLDQVFQVEKRIGLIVRSTIVGIAVNLGLNGWFVFGMEWGLFGVALATTLSYWFMLFGRLYGLRSMGYRVAWWSHARWVAWLGLFVALAMYSSRFVTDFGQGVVLVVVEIVVQGALVAAALAIATVLYPGTQRVLLKSIVDRYIAKIRQLCSPS